MPLHSTLATALIGQGEYDTAHQMAEAGLELARERDDRSGESSLINAVGLIAMEQGDLTAAAQAFERSLMLERETGNRAREGLRLNNLGSVYPRLGDYAKAHQHLADGLKLARAVGRREVEADVLLNTASVAHLEGDDASALAYANGLLAEPIVAHLAAGGSLDGTEEPLLIPLSCYQALSAAGDRASEVLAGAHDELLLQAERITDPAARRGFLHQVPHHREIRQAWSRPQQLSRARKPRRSAHAAWLCRRNTCRCRTASAHVQAVQLKSFAPAVVEEAAQRFAHGAKGEEVPGNLVFGKQARLE